MKGNVEADTGDRAGESIKAELLPGMTAEQVARVQRTWRQLTHDGADIQAQVDENIASFGLRVFANLFQEHPRLTAMFPLRDEATRRVDWRRVQAHSLTAFSGFDAAVRMLAQPGDVAQLLLNLIERHIKYGVEAQHYAFLTAAIAATLAEVLGPRWAGEEKAAWVALVGVLHTLVEQVYAKGAKGS